MELILIIILQYSFSAVVSDIIAVDTTAAVLVIIWAEY
jgi:hypothetical protein